VTTRPAPSDPAEAVAASWPRRALHALRTRSGLRPFRNAGLLTLGSGAQGLLQLGAIALAAQALGATGLGMLVLVNTARRFVGGLIRLRSKHVVLRYGARALAEGAGPGAFKRVLSFALWLDILSALAGLAAVLLAMGAAVRWLEMPPEVVGPARAFGVCVVFVALSTTAEALLRLFDRFDVVAGQNLVSPVVQLGGAALGLALGAGLPFFLAVWFLSVAASHGTLTLGAVYELHRRGRLRELSLHPRHLAPPEPGTWRFVISTNLLDALGKLRENGTVLAVGALLDPAAAALLQVARKLGQMPGKPVSKIINPVMVPEFARQTADARHRKRRKTVKRASVISGGLGLGLFALLALLGQPLLTLGFGPEFAAAYPVMLIFGVAGVLRMATFAFGPVLVSAGRMKMVVVADILMTVGQIGLLVVLIPQVGLAGSALAQVGGVLLSATVLIPAGRRELRRPRAEALPT